jgi:predicted NodU family carbamoyl transferase
VNILSYNPGHDGAIAYLKDGELSLSVEAEKDSNYRYAALSIPQLLDGMGELQELPDVICSGGWWPRDHHEYRFGSTTNSGYRGVSASERIITRQRFMRGRVDFFSSSHERSHLFCAFGMSPFPKGTACYALVWEGHIGAFYELDSQLNVTLLADVLEEPGNRYAMLYGLADPTFPKDGPYPRTSDAGKLMALASFSRRSTPNPHETRLLSFLLDGPRPKLSDAPSDMPLPYLDVGLEDQDFRDFAGIYSEAIFNKFYAFAAAHLKKGLPLIIAGGCGLNCDWNTKWRETRLFSDVFIPPVANDSGSAIGTAVDAQHHFTGNPKVAWNVYSGLPFRSDTPISPDRYSVRDADVDDIAARLDNGQILGWVSGRYEIGPRALGNRSILAAPFQSRSRARLNEIKQREAFRPIAPVCLLEDAQKWFGCPDASPYMLYTYRATTDALAAVTHVNGTARLQTVTPTSNRDLCALLHAFKRRTGYGVLCNTSLNFKSKGLINNLTDLDTYSVEHGLDGFVVDGRLYVKKR